MNRFRVTIAKEKLLRLREKYSKNTNEEENSSSESLISMKFVRSPEQKNNVQKKTPIFNSRRGLTTFNDGLKEDADILKTEIESHEDLIKQESRTKATDDYPFEKQLSSESLVLSNLSNQLEQIRFISSSSENLSIVHSENLSIVHSENTKSKSIISSGDIPSSKSQKVYPDKETQSFNHYVEIEFSEGGFDGLTTIRSPLKNELLKSSSGTSSFSGDIDTASTISSVKELNSEGDIGSILSNKSLLNITIKSNEDIVDTMSSPLQNIIIGGQNSKLNSISNTDEKTSLENVLRAKKTHISKALYEDSSDLNKHIKSEIEKNNFVGRLSLNKLTPTEDSLDDFKVTKTKYVNTSTNTDPVKVISLRKKPTQNQPKHRANNKEQLTEKMKKRSRSNFYSKKHDFNSKQSINRQFVKPCNLIRPDEINNLRFENAWYQDLHSSRYNYVAEFYKNSISVTEEINRDEVINQLLKNQITLTRHFIESHQHLYLQVCKAAQLLNENYLQNQ